MKKSFSISFFISRIIMICIILPLVYFGNMLVIGYAYTIVEFNEFQVNVIDYVEISRNPTWSGSQEYVITVDVDISYEDNGEHIYEKISMKILEADYNDGDFTVYGLVKKSDSTFRRYVAYNETMIAYIFVCAGGTLYLIAFLLFIIIIVGFYQRIKCLKVEKKVNDLDRIDANESDIYKDYDDDVFEKYMKKK